jgi:AbrB family looped-hinge helix DNA binding protein
MQSTITSKFQTTIPKAIREDLNLSVRDIIEWKVERGKVFVSPVHKEFLKYRNSIKTGSGDISEDIRLARERRTEKYLWKK